MGRRVPVVVLVAALALVVTACGGGGGGGGAVVLATATAQAGQPTVITVTSGAQAGTSVTIPADAIPAGTTVTVASIGALRQVSFANLGSTVRITVPAVLTASATVTIPYDAAALTALGAQTSDLVMMKLSGGAFIAIEGADLTIGTSTIAALIGSFSDFGAGTSFLAAPSGLTATALSPSQVRLTWTDNSPNNLTFLIERREGGPFASLNPFASVGETAATAFVDTGLAAHTDYHYRVLAVTPIRESEPSPIAVFEVAPASPSGLTATANGGFVVDLAWNDNSSNETGFEIRRATATSGGGTLVFTTIDTVATDVESYSDTTATPTTTYQYGVNAKNDAGTAPSNLVTVITGSAPPPTIQVSKSSLDFGTVAVGETATLTFTVTNTGSAGSTLSGTASASGVFSIVSGGTYSLGTGVDQTITVGFTPTAAVVSNSNLTLTGGAGATVSLAGIGATPILSLSPGYLDFGIVSVGDNKTLVVTVKNKGIGTLSGSASAQAPFSIVGSASYSLGAGDTKEISVKYTPTLTGTQQFSGDVSFGFTGGTGRAIRCTGTDSNPLTSALFTDFGTSGEIAATNEELNAVALDRGYLYLVADSNRVEKRDAITGALVTSFGSQGQLLAFGETFRSMLIVDNSMYLLASASVDKWVITKRGLATGAVDSAFSVSGPTTSTARMLASDGDNLYVAGSPRDGLGPWRIEKRSLLTGGLDAGFNGSGFVETRTSAKGVGALVLEGLSVYSSFIAKDANGDLFHWIERRDEFDGSLQTDFSTTGAVTFGSTVLGFSSLASVAGTTSLYFGCVETGPTVVVRKLSRFDAGLDTAFGTQGIVTSGITPNFGATEGGLVTDGASLYLFAGATVKVEKRDASSGGLVTSFGTNGLLSTADGFVKFLLLDTTSIYVGVSRPASGQANWRIERRGK